MAPAFSSRLAAAGFAILLAALLALPLLVTLAGGIPREHVYRALPNYAAPAQWQYQEIFERHEPIDIALIGPSRLRSALDAAQIERELSVRLGRPATVVNLSRPFAGADASFTIARDLLAHRRVQLLVSYDEAADTDTPHRFAHWFFPENPWAPELVSLPLRQRLAYYSGAVIGTPRHLLSLLRPDRLEAATTSENDAMLRKLHAPPLAEHRGSLVARISLNSGAAFDDSWNPPSTAMPALVRRYSNETRPAFTCGDGSTVPPLQMHFLRLLIAEARAHATRVVMFHIPILKDATNPTIVERACWPEQFGADVEMLGLPEAEVFAGLASTDVQELYYDSRHLNAHGQKIFTRLLTPALLDLYDSAKPR